MPAKKSAKHSAPLINITKLLYVAVVALIIAIGFLSADRVHQSRKLDDASTQIALIHNEMENTNALLKPAVSAKENRVYFPEIKLSLPYNDVTKYLQYSYDSKDTSISSALVSDRVMRQLDCTQLVRLNFNDNRPYSPWEELAGSVKLQDGRTMNIFAAKAFESNEGSTADCPKEVWQQVTPQQVGDAFKSAESY
jgi:hypothetical protein